MRERQNHNIERHIAKLEENVQHINKWQKFKEMRAAVIDKYMVLKRKQLRVYKLCSTIKLANIMLHLKETIKFADQRAQKQITRLFILIKIKILWTRRIRKFQGMDGIYRNFVIQKFCLSQVLFGD